MILIMLPKTDFDMWVIQARQRIHSLKDQQQKLVSQRELAVARGEEVHTINLQIAEIDKHLSFVEPHLQTLKMRAKHIIDWEEPPDPEVTIEAPPNVTVNVKQK